MSRWLAVVILMVSMPLPACHPPNALASGFAIYEQGVAAMANGGAFAARASDPSAVYFNPAAIVGLEGVQVMGGTTAVLLRNGYFTSDATRTRFDQVGNVTFPSFLYITQRVGHGWGWGAGITFPSGVKTEWGPTFPGRFLSREASLTVVNANVNVAAALGNGWAAAAGIDYLRGDVETLSRNLDLGPLGFPGLEGTSRLTGDGAALGWNAALRWAGASGWRWGGSYRSAEKLHIQGRVQFGDIPPELQPLFPDGDAEGVLPLPATFATGLAYVSQSGWEGEFDIVWTGWSDFQHLALDFENNTFYGGEPVVADVLENEDWHDSFSFRAGVVRRLAARHRVRLGGYFDQTPVPADHLRPRLPDANRWSLQAGYGFGAAGGFFADVAYQAILLETRRAVGNPSDATNPVLPGEYGNFISRLGLGMGWRF